MRYPEVSMRRTIGAAFAAVAIAGCGAAHAPEPVPSATPTATPKPPEATLSITWDDVRFGEGGPAIFSVNDMGREGADAMLKLNGKDDYFITPLGEALTRARSQGRLGDRLHIVTEPDISLRLIVEVLFTAEKMKVTGFDIEEAHAPSRKVPIERAVDVPVANAGPADEQIGLGLLFTSGGVGMTTSRGNILPGCEHHPPEIGPRLTLPKVDGQIDFSALGACARSVKTGRPELEGIAVATLVASAKEPPTMGEVMRVAVVLHGKSGEGAFPDLRLAMIP